MSTDPGAHLVADQLREAWLSIDGEDAFADAQRLSLEASAAGDPSLMMVIADLKAPIQAELDLHLAGSGVTDHETTADPLGKFLSRSAAAVKELAKSISGKERFAMNLRAFAPAPGSVRVVLRAPVPRTTQETIPKDAIADTIDTLALQRLASIISHTNEIDEASPLLADVQELRAGARSALRLVAKTVLDGGWDVEGSFRQRGKREERIALTQGGAHRLIAATNQDVTERRTETVIGEIDGQRRSLGAMWFVPDGGRTFEAAVTEAQLLRRVAELAADPARKVNCTFDVFVTYPAGDIKSARRSYALIQIEEAPSRPSLPLGR